jgi:hypothetical protein
MRCGRPADTAQIITIVVGTDGHVVLAVQGDHVWDGPLSADTVRTGAPTAEDLDAGQDQDVGVAGQ